MIDAMVGLLVLLGAGFALVGSIGLARFPDTFTRLHGPTKATTLGVGAILVGSMLFFSTEPGGSLLRPILIAVFLFVTAPISAHLLAKAAVHRRCESVCDLPPEPGPTDPDP